MTPSPHSRTAGNLIEQLTELWAEQMVEWPALAEGMTALRQAKTRSFLVDGSPILAQCNPARFKSSSARVEAGGVPEGDCFLCPHRLPPRQRGVRYGERWLILCNPAPIFEAHFTIVATAHEPQRVMPALATLLDLSRDLAGALTVFYNGPSCGASAPHHLHLQAVPMGAMPFEAELATAVAAGNLALSSGRLDWLPSAATRIGTTSPRWRPAVVLVEERRDALIRHVELVIEALGEIRPASPEPMMNLLAAHANGRWMACLFPRAAHRPADFGTGPDNYLISPGTIDLGGVLITPLEKDFSRLTDEKVRSVYEEVLISAADFARFRERLLLRMK